MCTETETSDDATTFTFPNRARILFSFSVATFIVIADSKVVDKFPLNFPSNNEDLVYDKIETSKSRDDFWLVKLTVLFSDESQECAEELYQRFDI